MKSLKGIIARYIIIVSVVMSVIAFGVLFAVVYYVYADHDTSVFELLLPMAVLLLIEIAVSTLVAFKASKTIIKPINRLNPSDPKSTVCYKELSPLVEKIESQNEQIAQQITDLRLEHENQDAMRRDFTANVSHELKTPLTSISGYAEIIKNGIAKEEDTVRLAGKIYDESQRLITLVGDIIKLSRLDSQELPIEIERFDLYEVCQDVLSQLEMAAAERKITMELQGEKLELVASRKIVEEIVFNLCDNAVKYNRENGKVIVNIKQCMDGIQLKVSDTGIGIPKEDVDRIFERFYRVDKSHSKEIGGTGLGLSIVKHGAKYLGASVSVESELGVGTSIRIVF